MSQNKDRSIQRRVAFLKRLAAVHPYGLRAHCEGGFAIDNPDVQRLLRDRHIKIERDSGFPKHLKRFQQHLNSDRGFMRLYGCSGDGIRWTRAFITEAGKQFLAKHDRGPSHDDKDREFRRTLQISVAKHRHRRHQQRVMAWLHAKRTASTS